MKTTLTYPLAFPTSLALLRLARTVPGFRVEVASEQVDWSSPTVAPDALPYLALLKELRVMVQHPKQRPADQPIECPTHEYLPYEYPPRDEQPHDLGRPFLSSAASNDLSTQLERAIERLGQAKAADRPATDYLLVPRQELRIHRPGIESRVCSPLAQGLPLTRIDHPLLGPVLLEPPEIGIARAALDLAARVRRGQLVSSEATIRLVDLVDELCGSYARHPLHPRSEQTTFFLEPVTSIATIGSVLRMAPVHGSVMARQAVGFAEDGFASPMEVALQTMLCLPARLGGLGLPRPAVNQPLDFSDTEQGVVSHRTLTPDLAWLDCASVVEYNGTTHDEEGSFAEDLRRINDYSSLGLAAFVFSRRSLSSVGAFDAQARLLVHHMARTKGRDWERSVENRMHDDRYQAERVDLLDFMMGRRPRVAH